jgi:hypothetical protein
MPTEVSERARSKGKGKRVKISLLQSPPISRHIIPIWSKYSGVGI